MKQIQRGLVTAIVACDVAACWVPRRMRAAAAPQRIGELVLYGIPRPHGDLEEFPDWFQGRRYHLTGCQKKFWPDKTPARVAIRP